MTSNNQVSPVIRISRGERDASARATHLEAASKKYLETTIERKQMSKTTNFKRIALVAVAALGLGVLSSVPSQAVINADSLTLSSATATQTTAETYTATSAVATATFFGVQNDSISVTAALVSAPAGNTALPVIRVVETSTANVDTNVANAGQIGLGKVANSASVIYQGTNTSAATVKYAVYLATTDANDSSGNGMVMAPATAGTYVVKLTPAAIGAGPLVGATAQTLTITVTAAASLDTNASAAKSTAVLVKGGAYTAAAAKAQTADSVVAVANTAGTFAGLIYVAQLNAAGTTSANESMTAVISGQGILGAGSDTKTAATGRSISVKNGDFVTVYADGAAGKGVVTITGSTSGAVLATKTVVFTGALASFTDATAAVAILTTAAANAVTFKAKDSGLNVLSSGTYYAFSSDTTIATVGTVTYATDSGTVEVTGVKAGTVTITIGNATTLAASTIKSSAVALRVGSAAIASVKVAFDKATYNIGEKAIITVTGLDATSLVTIPGTLANFFAASGGLKEDKLFSQNPLSVDSTTVKFDAATSATAGTTAGVATYVVYMPLTSGTVKVTGTLGANANLAAAIQGTDVTASATVTDSGSAALAAVTALATTVASLRTLIVTLTNLVLKIQKKVKA
jgi:hypothetical protein